MVVKWELGLITALGSALMLGAVPLRGTLGQVAPFCLAPIFGTCPMHLAVHFMGFVDRLLAAPSDLASVLVAVS